MNHPANKGAISLLAGALLLASSVAFGNVEPLRPGLAKELQQARTYTVRTAPSAPLEIAKPALPDISGYTAEAVAAKIVRSTAGKVSVRRMMQENALKDFIGGDNKMAEWVVRQGGIPQAIFIDDGYVNLKDQHPPHRLMELEILKRFINEALALLVRIAEVVNYITPLQQLFEFRDTRLLARVW